MQFTLVKKKKKHGASKIFLLSLLSHLSFKVLDLPLGEKGNLFCNLAHSYEESLTMTHAMDALLKCKRK